MTSVLVTPAVELGPGESLGGPGTSGRPASGTPPRTFSADPAAFPAPSSREEQWRFTPLAPLRPLLRGEVEGGELPVECELPDGVSLTRVPPAELPAGLPLATDPLAAAAALAATTALHLTVAAHSTPAGPAVLRWTGCGQRAFGRVVVEIGPGADVTVVLQHTGVAQYAAQVSVLVGAGARCTLVSLQAWEPGSVHAAQYDLRVDRDARLRCIQASLGGDLVRIVENVSSTGPGTDVDLSGVLLAGDGQHLEHRLLVEHATPHCRSRVAYKAALHGAAAHTVWVGDVVIGPAAVGTDTYELNRNLVLTDGARADSVPNLEIFTGEVAGAGHASATGRFDDDALFYLQSRGIPAATARRLVVRGFLADIVDKVPVADLRQRIADVVESELDRALGAG